MVPGAERKLREQRGLSSEYLVRAHQKSPGPPQARGFGQPSKTSQRAPEEGTSLLCKTAPDICASNPQAISYVDKADLSHVLPAYPDAKNNDPRYTFGDKSEASVIDSRLSGFADKEGLIDSRILSDSRQNMIAFTENKEHPVGQEPRYTEFSPKTTEQNVVDSRLSGFTDKEGLLDSRLSGYGEKNESLLDTPFGYDTRYNSLAGQTVPITLKNQNTSVSAIQSQYIYQNFGTIHSGILKVSEPGTSSSSNSSQRSMTLQNPKRKSQIAQNTFSTMECEKRKRGPGLAGKTGFYTGSAPLHFEILFASDSCEPQSVCVFVMHMMYIYARFALGFPAGRWKNVGTLLQKTESVLRIPEKETMIKCFHKAAANSNIVVL
ncbi:hypothetical protein E2986_13013 [Frieseomelitta varia]|uniref:Uncharacterized protein n=1 Tax=Frieseomelitta varia TaxID=561572 RepID=A0A833S0X4_9HYME|nr:hypothetical protein E2986_13013 [Frieseomelitta varia]